MSIKGAIALFPDWYIDKQRDTAWRDALGHWLFRWHVSYREKNEIVQDRGKSWLVPESGYYWYTADWSKGLTERYSSMFGPFTSMIAALADCETAHK